LLSQTQQNKQTTKMTDRADALVVIAQDLPVARVVVTAVAGGVRAAACDDEAFLVQHGAGWDEEAERARAVRDLSDFAPLTAVRVLAENVCPQAGSFGLDDLDRLLRVHWIVGGGNRGGCGDRQNGSKRHKSRQPGRPHSGRVLFGYLLPTKC
jgi:hypothetical protein